jgi:hypothetical protein
LLSLLLVSDNSENYSTDAKFKDQPSAARLLLEKLEVRSQE